MEGGLDEAFGVGVGLSDKRVLLEFGCDELCVLKLFDPVFAEEHLNFLSLLQFLAKSRLTLSCSSILFLS